MARPALPRCPGRRRTPESVRSAGDTTGVVGGRTHRPRVRVAQDRQTRRFFGGRQPLCGSGVTSSIALTFIPAAWSAVMADSRPAPGPFTRTSISFTPNFDALDAHSSAARWAANGVLFRLPLNPTVPPDDWHRVSPFVSVMVTIVLLNVLCTWAIPRLTLRRAFFFLLFAIAVSRVRGSRDRLLVLHALLAGDRLANALAGP